MAAPLLPAEQGERGQDPLSLLVRGASALGLPLTDATRRQFQTYERLLALWGRKINLTALHDPLSAL